MASTQYSIGTDPRAGLRDLLHRRVKPRPDLTLSQFADREFQLRGESSSNVGPWKTLPFQKEIMDLISHPREVNHIVFVKPARVGATKMSVAAIGYWVKHDPRSVLVIQPTDDDARGFSKEELTPYFEGDSDLRATIGDAKARDSSNSLQRKVFPGGTLHLGSSVSGRWFRRITVSRAFLDEVDGYPPSAGGEGDHRELARGRMLDAVDPIGGLLVEWSTPRVKPSKIWTSWEESDQRLFFVPCPFCDHGQALEWGGPDCDYGIKWRDGDPSTVYYLCEYCHEAIKYSSQKSMIAQGRYESQNPAGLFPGFRIWGGYSPLPAASWQRGVEWFLSSKNDPEKLQTFVNLYLAEPFEDLGESPPAHLMMERRERFPTVQVPDLRPESATGKREAIAMPKGSAIVTGFADIQLWGIEFGWESWGSGEENWKLGYHVFPGSPTEPQVWRDFLDFIVEPIPAERGGVEFIRAIGVDSGAWAEDVYRFVAANRVLHPAKGITTRLFATKGRSSPNDPIWPMRPPKVTKDRPCPVYVVNVDAAKSIIFERTKITEPGPGCMHFPLHFDEPYFNGFAAEHLVTERGRRRFVKKPGVSRNEPLDIAVGNFVILRGITALSKFDLEATAAKADSEIIMVRNGVAVSAASPDVGSGAEGEDRGARAESRDESQDTPPARPSSDGRARRRPKRDKKWLA